MLEASQFVGQITQEYVLDSANTNAVADTKCGRLGDKNMEENALKTFQEADDFLAPQDAMTRDLADVKPVYSAIFTFADEGGDFRLFMSWMETQDASCESVTFEPIANKWTRLERDSATPSSLVDMSLTDLNTGLAWQFDIQVARPVDKSRLPKTLIDFAYSVRIDAKEAHKVNSDKSFIIHKPYVGHLKSIQQQVSYRYYLIPSDYTLELARFQNRSFPPRKSTVLPLGEATVQEPRWSVQVWRGEWDKEFTENENLAIGEQVDWRDDGDTWFPEDLNSSAHGNIGAGFRELMKKLKRVGKMVREQEIEELLGGMTVGGFATE